MINRWCSRFLRWISVRIDHMKRSKMMTSVDGVRITRLPKRQVMLSCVVGPSCLPPPFFCFCFWFCFFGYWKVLSLGRCSGLRMCLVLTTSQRNKLLLMWPKSAFTDYFFALPQPVMRLDRAKPGTPGNHWRTKVFCFLFLLEIFQHSVAFHCVPFYTTQYQLSCLFVRKGNRSRKRNVVPEFVIVN